MNYNLNQKVNHGKKASAFKVLVRLIGINPRERQSLFIGASAVILNQALNLTAFVLIGYVIDNFIQTREFRGLLVYSSVLLLMYLLAASASHIQTKLMGRFGLKILFSLRNNVFNKLQQLPYSFFKENKAGDLIARVNNDTEKLNTFFSSSLLQFIGGSAMMTGATIFLIVTDYRLALAALFPVFFIATITWLVNPYVDRKNALSLQRSGQLSAEVLELLSNFSVIASFNRQDYLRERIKKVNQLHYTAAIDAGLANNILIPIYETFANVAQLFVLLAGIYLISQNSLTVGLLISYIILVNQFYGSIKLLSSLWGSFKQSMAGWARIDQILTLDSDLPVMRDLPMQKSSSFVELRNVSFAYDENKLVLRNVSLELTKGNTYAFVGPTGGGKSTLASLIARISDPTSGTIFLDGRDLRSYSPDELCQNVGFILQEPFLFEGTVRENILYGNDRYLELTEQMLENELRQNGLLNLINYFESGLNTPVQNISIGQRQLVAFIRAVLRKPELLILDEATANIDTQLENLLDEVLAHLPATTTKIMIAHRLNTIKNADGIFFINAGNVVPYNSLIEVVSRLKREVRVS